MARLRDPVTFQTHLNIILQITSLSQLQYVEKEKQSCLEVFRARATSTSLSPGPRMPQEKSWSLENMN